MKHFCSSIAVLFFIFTSALPAQAAEWEGVFDGTLGKSTVVVQLDAGPENSSFKGCCSDGSRYYYVPRNYDLKLVLEKAGDTLEFSEISAPHYTATELAANDPARTGFWSLRVTGDTAKGKWTSSDKKRILPIELKRRPLIDQAQVPVDGHRLAMTYHYRWLKDVTISGAKKPLVFDAVKLAYEKDSAFGLLMPIFTSMPNKAVMARANALLRNYYQQSLIQNRECINGLRSEADVPKQPEYRFEVVYASPTVVTISESGSVFCGGAHPNNYVSYFSFDLRDGKQIGGRYQLDLSPNGFGAVLKLANKDQRIAFENFALARWHTAAKTAGDPDDGCSGPGFMNDQAPGEKEFNLSFSPLGIAIFRNDYPHAASNCLFQDFNPTVIPWADLKPWLRPDQKLLYKELSP